MATSPLARSIILTLAYTDQFGFPLSDREIYQRVIVSPLGSFSAFSFKELEQELIRLVKANILTQQGKRYVLVGSEQAFGLRIQREKISQPKWQQAAQCVVLLQWIPWLKGIFVTGSVAMNDASAEDDVDFMLVAEKNRLWLVRALVIVMTSLFGKRRSWSHGEANSWCFNVWVDSNHLAVDVSQRSLYIAYEVIQARCVWGKDTVATDFLRQNEWVTEFLPHGIVTSQTVSTKIQSNDWWIGWLMSIVDWLAYQVQLLYMKPHRTRERVSRGFAFFHPRDTKTMIMDGWKQSLKRLSQQLS